MEKGHGRDNSLMQSWTYNKPWLVAGAGRETVQSDGQIVPTQQQDEQAGVVTNSSSCRIDFAAELVAYLLLWGVLFSLLGISLQSRGLKMMRSSREKGFKMRSVNKEKEEKVVNAHVEIINPLQVIAVQFKGQSLIVLRLLSTR